MHVRIVCLPNDGRTDALGRRVDWRHMCVGSLSFCLSLFCHVGAGGGRAGAGGGVGVGSMQWRASVYVACVCLSFRVLTPLPFPLLYLLLFDVLCCVRFVRRREI